MWVDKECRIKLNIVRSGYRIYPLVSNNVGIDFTELGPPHGSKPGGTAQVPSKGQGVEKQEDLVTIGFRVKLRKRQSFRTMLIGCTTNS
jgi:hypothetical protein